MTKKVHKTSLKLSKISAKSIQQYKKKISPKSNTKTSSKTNKQNNVDNQLNELKERHTIRSQAKLSSQCNLPSIIFKPSILSTTPTTNTNTNSLMYTLQNEEREQQEFDKTIKESNKLLNSTTTSSSSNNIYDMLPSFDNDDNTGKNYDQRPTLLYELKPSILGTLIPITTLTDKSIDNNDI